MHPLIGKTVPTKRKHKSKPQYITKRFVCLYCGISSERKANIERHTDRLHKGKQVYMDGRLDACKCTRNCLI